MSAVSLVACTAIDACSNVPVTSTLCRQFGGVNPSAILTNSQSQTMTLTRMGEVGKALGTSVSKLESVWKLGSAAAGAAGAIGQIKGCLGDIVGQGTSLAKQIQAVAKLLQTAVKIIDIVKAANAAVAALMSNPWTHAAARILASATAVKTLAWIAMVAQSAMSLGQALNAVQSATHKTDATTAAIGTALGDNSTGTPVGSPATPPFVPAASGNTSSTYPSYPTMTPAAGPAPNAGTGQGNGTPTVFGSGWVPARPPVAPATNTNITVSVGDFDGDGRNEIRVDVPQGRLNENPKINVRAKVGTEEVSGSFDIDV